jgi:hypothetical protein
MQKFILITIFLMFSFSCSNFSSMVSGLPSESGARDYYYKQGKSAIDDGQYKINYFKKLNGEESADKKNYTLYYEAQIEFLKNVKYTFMFQTTEFKAGDTKVIKGQYRYRLTDNGWKMLNDYGQIIE